MTDEQKKPKDVIDGFDLPEDDATPPPKVERVGEDAIGDFDLDNAHETSEASFGLDGNEGDSTGEFTREDFESESAVPADMAPRPAPKKKSESVKGKLVALVVIPLVTLAIIFIVQGGATSDWMEYEKGCMAVATEFMKGYSDNTDDSVANSYTVLTTTRLRNEVAGEVIEKNYADATKGLGKFRKLGTPDWSKDGTSFTATAQFDNGSIEVWASFIQLEKRGKTVYRIDGYRFGAD